MNSKKKRRFLGKQVLVVGLVALVLAAGYYRWTVGAIRNDAISVSSTAGPSGGTAETFWTKNEDKDNNKDNNNQDGQNNDTDKEQKDQQSDTAKTDVIAETRQQRDKLRGDTMDKWKEISSNKDASQTAKKEAEDNILKLTKNSQSENTIETNVKSKGFSDCFAQVSDSGVSVIVKGGNLDSSSVAQIKDIIIGETGVAASQIKISSEQ